MRSLAAFLCVLLFGGNAFALPLCDSDREQSVEVESPGPTAPSLNEGVADDAPPEEALLEILPCSVVDSGAFGPTCVDAAAYIITQRGNVLCQVAIPDGTNVFSDPVQLEDRHTPATTSYPEAQSVSGDLSALALAIRPPTILLVRAGTARLLGPASCDRDCPDVPS